MSGRSFAAFAYLIVFGSWIGVSAYVWLPKNAQDHHTESRLDLRLHHPVIAVFLGWALLGESLNAHMPFGALVVLAGVMTIGVPAGAVTNVLSRVRREFAR